jgi:small subunit ribosomal protein S5
MLEENNSQNIVSTNGADPERKESKTTVSASSNRRGGGRGRGGNNRRGGRDKEKDTHGGETKDYEQKILELSRVTRVTAGGKRMRFRAAVVVGNRNGKVGFGVAKGADVAMAVEKAFRQAKKKVFVIPIHDQTVPHAVEEKFGAAVVLLKPAPKGTGLKAGGAVRTVLELGGVPNAVSKIFGSSNKINVAKATIQAMKKLRLPVPKNSSEVK